MLLSNRPLGPFDGPFEAQSAFVAPSSGLLIVTDGITEAMAPDGRQFGLERLLEVVRAAAAPTAEQLIQATTDATSGFREHLPQHGDVTVLALVRSGNRAGGGD